MEDRDDGAAAMSIAGSPEFGVAEGDDEGGGFSFPVPPLAADACIVPVYPIFGRPLSPPAEEPGPEMETATVRVPLGRLLLEERDFRARQRGGSSLAPPSGRQTEEEEDGALDGVPPESYCLWAPGQSAPASPRRCRKSGSTGSVLRWRRISERLVGRSHSDGKEKFVFLNAVAEPQPRNADADEGAAGGSSSSKDGDGGWKYYGKGSGAGGGSGGRRRSYLPYKQELVGLFANVSGLRRSYHPF